jgi:uncharacterized protein YjiS (DUF1127 family)
MSKTDQPVDPPVPFHKVEALALWREAQRLQGDRDVRPQLAKMRRHLDEGKLTLEDIGATEKQIRAVLGLPEEEPKAAGPDAVVGKT